MFNTVGYLQFASGLFLLFEAFKPSDGTWEPGILILYFPFDENSSNL